MSTSLTVTRIGHAVVASHEHYDHCDLDALAPAGFDPACEDASGNCLKAWKLRSRCGKGRRRLSLEDGDGY